MALSGTEDVGGAINSGGTGDDAGGRGPTAGAAQCSGGGGAQPQAVEAGIITVGSMRDQGAEGPGDVLVDRQTVLDNVFRMGDLHETTRKEGGESG